MLAARMPCWIVTAPNAKCSPICCSEVLCDLELVLTIVCADRNTGLSTRSSATSNSRGLRCCLACSSLRRANLLSNLEPRLGHR